MYQVLARKYRPRNFNQLVGQTHVSKALTSALERNRLHHAYLFTGTRGVGKTTIARILSKCLNCETGITATPCEVCATCTAINQGRFIDLIEIDAASRTKVEDTRELLDNVPYAPTQGRYKVYLIDEVHMLSTHSFNALLKTLEEPPEHVKFLLATTDPQKLPITVLSRCLQFTLRPLQQQEIHDHLQDILSQEQIVSDDKALWQLAEAAQGSLRDALSLTDQAIAYGQGQLGGTDVQEMLGLLDKSQIVNLLQGIHQNHTVQVSQLLQNLSSQAVDLKAVLDQLISLLHQLALLQVLPQIPVQGTLEYQTQLRQLAQSIDRTDIQLYYQIALQGRQDLKLSVSLQQGFDMCILRMLAFKPLTANHETIESSVNNQTDNIGSVDEQAVNNQSLNNQAVNKQAINDKSAEQSHDAVSDIQGLNSEAQHSEPWTSEHQQPELTNPALQSHIENTPASSIVPELHAVALQASTPQIEGHTQSAAKQVDESAQQPSTFEAALFETAVVAEEGIDTLSQHDADNSTDLASPAMPDDRLFINDGLFAYDNFASDNLLIDESLFSSEAQPQQSDLDKADQHVNLQNVEADNQTSNKLAEKMYPETTQPETVQPDIVQPAPKNEPIQAVKPDAFQQKPFQQDEPQQKLAEQPVANTVLGSLTQTHAQSLLPQQVLQHKIVELSGQWDIEKWECWLRETDLSPGVRNLAQHGLMQGQIGQQHRFVIAPEHRLMATELMEGLSAALKNQWPDSQIELTFSSIDQPLPLELKQLRYEQALQQADYLMRHEPVVQQLIQQFNASLQEISLKD